MLCVASLCFFVLSSFPAVAGVTKRGFHHWCFRHPDFPRPDSRQRCHHPGFHPDGDRDGGRHGAAGRLAHQLRQIHVHPEQQRSLPARLQCG